MGGAARRRALARLLGGAARRRALADLARRARHAAAGGRRAVGLCAGAAGRAAAPVDAAMAGYCAGLSRAIRGARPLRLSDRLGYRAAAHLAGGTGARLAHPWYSRRALAPHLPAP